MELLISITVVVIAYNYIATVRIVNNLIVDDNTALSTICGIKVGAGVSPSIIAHEKTHNKYLHPYIIIITQSLGTSIFFYNFIEGNWWLVASNLVLVTALNILVRMLCECIADRNALNEHPQYVEDLEKHLISIGSTCAHNMLHIYITGTYLRERALRGLEQYKKSTTAYCIRCSCYIFFFTYSIASSNNIMSYSFIFSI